MSDEENKFTPKKGFKDDIIERLLRAEWWKKAPPGEVVRRFRSTVDDALTLLTSEDVSDVRDEDIKLWIEPVSTWDRVRRQR